MELNQGIEEVFLLAEKGDASRLHQILQSEQQLANTQNENGLTPLGYAAHFGQADAVKVLLDAGADVNEVSQSKLSFIPSNTALHAAIAGARNLDVIKLLLARGAQTNIDDSNGHTSLHTAAFHDDNEAIIRLLIEYGANVNASVEDKGITPLRLAVKQGNSKVAELLRENGAE